MEINKLMKKNFERISILRKNRLKSDEQELTTRIMIHNNVHTGTDEELLDMFSLLNKQLGDKHGNK